MQEKLWLYEDPQRESNFMKSFKSNPWMLFSLTYKMFIDGSLDSDFIWLLFNYKFRTKFVIKDYESNPIDKSNIEVDIIGGKCKSHVCHEDKSFKIRPLLDFIIAIEVKCSRYDRKNDELNAKQSDSEQEKIQRQLYDRLQMGFNKVSSLDILFTNPGEGQGIWAWFNAADNIYNVHNIMEKDGIFEGRLNNKSLDAVGQYFFGKGSVKKDDIDESLSGSGEAVVKKKSTLNPFLKNKDVIDNRQIMERIFENIGITRQIEGKLDNIFFLYPVLIVQLNKDLVYYLFQRI